MATLATYENALECPALMAQTPPRNRWCVPLCRVARFRNGAFSVKHDFQLSTADRPDSVFVHELQRPRRVA